LTTPFFLFYCPMNHIPNQIPNPIPPGRRLGHFFGALLLILLLAPLGLLCGLMFVRFGHGWALSGIAGSLLLAALVVHLCRARPVLGDSVRVGVMLVLGGLILAYGMREMRQRELAARPVSNPISVGDRQAAERAAAWTAELSRFTIRMPAAEAKALYAADGLQAKCYGDLRPRDRMRPDDTEVCWMPIRELWGIPAVDAVLWFGQDGLHQMRFGLPAERWPEVEKALDSRGSRLRKDFGVDDVDTAIQGWRINGVLVLSAPDRRRDARVTVLWNGK